MIELAPDVWQFRGFPPHAINFYLVGDVLIDAGTRWDRRKIERQLQGRRLSMVALTHCHPDHQGMVDYLCRTHNLPLACPAGDVAAMEGREPMQPQSPFLAVSKRLFSGPPHKVDRVLNEGDEVAGFRVIAAPGHTAGHVIFFRESDRVAIAGDVLRNMSYLTTLPGLREPPAFFTVDVELNRQSIRRLAELSPSLVCFGHGPPLRQPELLQKFVERLP
jgi:hydroxyacylglutathione hydrolase